MRSSPTSLPSWCRSLSSEMRKGFNPESLIWKPLGALGDLVMLSLLWTLFSVPVVTLGPASAALYDAAVHGIRRKEDTVITRFFAAFRRELREGVLLTLIWAAIALALWAAAAYGPLPLPAVPGFVLLFFLLCVQCWLWPALSRFAMKPGARMKSALPLAFGHILRSVPMAALWAVTIWAGLRFIAPFFVCPALAALLCSRLIEPVFRQYE